jgi:ferredoxin
MSTRVQIDPTRCAGHGICALILDDRVRLDEWGFPHATGDDLDSDTDVRRARRAARACPRQALYLAVTAST